MEGVDAQDFSQNEPGCQSFEISANDENQMNLESKGDVKLGTVLLGSFCR